MDLSTRLPGVNNICGLEIDLTGTAVPASVDFLDRFYDSSLTGDTRKGVYYGFKSLRFREIEKRTAAGTHYEQEISFHFPNHDHDAIARVNEFRKARYLLIKNSHNQVLIMGRNDHKQNRPPICIVERNENLTQIKYKTMSLHMLGFVDYNLQGLPHDAPLTLFG